MSEDASLPSELQDLVEKREQTKRRQKDRRETDDPASLPEHDRRSGLDRRTQKRRKDD